MTLRSTPVSRISETFTRTAQVLLACGFAIWTSGCEDKAQPKYDECVAFEAKWETVKARDACKAAVEASPDSKAGKLAAGKLTYLEAEAKKILDKKAVKEAPCKTGKWVTHCKWKDKPRPNLLEATTYARCNQDADEVRVVGMVCPECECSDRFVDPYAEK